MHFCHFMQLGAISGWRSASADKLASNKSFSLERVSSICFTSEARLLIGSQKPVSGPQGEALTCSRVASALQLIGC